MNRDKQEYKDIKDELIKLSKEYMSTQEIEKFSLHIDEKLDNFEPTIMVYGTYNAGKSTLLNAIFGKEEMAKTGDAPETSEISQYTYNGYTIYDTPGINAPQEHQKVTDEHLNKCELILFVLNSDGSFEDRYVYEKISEIVKLKKPILIVINNKSNIEQGSLDEKQFIDKINLNLSKIGDEKGIDKIESKVNICMVHAKTALKAKLKNSQLLLKSSNIIQLENEIDKLLESAGHSEVVNALNIFIGDFIGNISVNIDNKIDNPEMKKTQELITFLQKLRQRTQVELKDIAMQNVQILTSNLLPLITAQNQQGSQELIEQTKINVIEQMNNALESVSQEINTRAEGFKKELQDIATNAQSIHLDIKEQIEDSGSQSSDIEEGIKKIMPLIPVTLAIPVVNIPVATVLAVVGALFSMFSSSSDARDKAEAEVQRQREQHLAAKNKADEIAMSFKGSLFSSINDSVSAMFDDFTATYVEISKQLSSDNEKLLQDKKDLQEILNKI